MSGTGTTPEIRRVRRDGEPLYQVKCPNCGRWGSIDDDQLRGRVSILHEECDLARDTRLQRRPTGRVERRVRLLARRTPWQMRAREPRTPEQEHE